MTVKCVFFSVSSVLSVAKKLCGLKNNFFSVEDGAVFAAELVILLACWRFAFDGAGLAEAYAAGHHFFHTDLAGDFFIAGELGDSSKHRARAAGVDNRLSGIETESVLRKPVQNASADKTLKARGAVVGGDE